MSEDMDLQVLARTRMSLHGVAELVLAGPQFATSQIIELRASPGGFGTVSAPDLRVEGDDLVAGSARIPMRGRTYGELAAAAGIEPRRLDDVYAEGPEVDLTDRIDIDPPAARLVADAFATGDVALRLLTPAERPVLWPEHFDIGISLDEVNYGVSPGDEFFPSPYAYVGPWQPHEGGFWNTPFGAARPLEELDTVDAVLAFFGEGRRLTGSAPAQA